MFELAKESCFVCKEVEVFSEMRVFFGWRGCFVFGFWFTIFPSVRLHLNSDRDKSGTASCSSKVLKTG